MTPLRSREERDQLVLENDGLIGFTLNTYFLQHEWWKVGDKRDAFQIGRLALLKAAERWDPSRGVKFNTLAVVYIRRLLARELSSGGLVRLPQINPTQKKECYWESENWRKLRIQRRNALHFLPIGGGENLRDEKAKEKFLEFLGGEDREKLKSVLQNALDGLSFRESDILLRRFFLDWKLAKIGKLWGITRERTRQIVEVGLEKLRGHQELREIWENLYYE